jgi:hypothetical protein
VLRPQAVAALDDKKVGLTLIEVGRDATAHAAVLRCMLTLAVLGDGIFVIVMGCRVPLVSFLAITIWALPAAGRHISTDLRRTQPPRADIPHPSIAHHEPSQPPRHPSRGRASRCAAVFTSSRAISSAFRFRSADDVKPGNDATPDRGKADSTIYFVGLENTVTGLLRDISRDAVRIIHNIVRQRNEPMRRSA